MQDLIKELGYTQDISASDFIKQIPHHNPKVRVLSAMLGLSFYKFGVKLTANRRNRIIMRAATRIKRRGYLPLVAVKDALSQTEGKDDVYPAMEAKVDDSVVLWDDVRIMTEIPYSVGKFFYIHGWPIHAVPDGKQNHYYMLRVRCVTPEGTKDVPVVLHYKQYGSLTKAVPSIETLGPIRTNQLTFACTATNPFTAERWFDHGGRMSAEGFAARINSSVAIPSDGEFFGSFRHQLHDNGKWQAGVGYWGGLAFYNSGKHHHATDRPSVYFYIEHEGRMITWAHGEQNILLDFHSKCARLGAELRKVVNWKDEAFDWKPYLRTVIRGDIARDANRSIVEKLKRIDDHSRWSVAWAIASEQNGLSPVWRERNARVAGFVVRKV